MCALEAAPTLRLEDITGYAYSNEEIDSGSLRRVLLVRAQNPPSLHTAMLLIWASISEEDLGISTKSTHYPCNNSIL